MDRRRELIEAAIASGQLTMEEPVVVRLARVNVSIEKLILEAVAIDNPTEEQKKDFRGRMSVLQEQANILMGVLGR